MASSLQSLHYVLPRTEFQVTVTPRDEIVPGDGGSRLHRTTEVAVLPRIAPDRGAACTMTLDEGLLESIELTAALTEDGIIESIGSTSSRDLTPVVGLLAKLAPLASTIAGGLLGVLPVQPSPTLEDEWAERHPRLASAETSLTCRLEGLLQELTAPAPASRVTQVGAALETLRRELALIDRFRREWIAGRSRDHEPRTWVLTAKDLLPVEEAGLPATAEFPRPAPHDAMWPMWSAGAAIAIADPGRNWTATVVDTTATDTIWVRRSRPVEVGVYQRDPLATSDVLDRDEGTGDVDSWTLQRSIRLNVVDELSTTESISLQGRIFRERTVQLGFHPDQSIRSYGVTSTSQVAAVATSVGGVVDAVAGGVKDVLGRPSESQRQLDQAELRLELLKTSSEWAQLSATQERAAELAELEQQVRLAELRSKV